MNGFKLNMCKTSFNEWCVFVILIYIFFQSRHQFWNFCSWWWHERSNTHRLFSIISGGGTLVVSQNRQPEAVLSHIDKYKVELLPTSPSFLNLVLISEAYKRYDCSSLKLITYGTEPMPEGLLKRLKTAAPRAEFKQTYGVTEIGILGTKSESSGSVWM